MGEKKSERFFAVGPRNALFRISYLDLFQFVSIATICKRPCSLATDFEMQLFLIRFLAGNSYNPCRLEQWIPATNHNLFFENSMVNVSTH